MKKPGRALETVDKSYLVTQCTHRSKIHHAVHVRFVSFTLCNILQSLKI